MYFTYFQPPRPGARAFEPCCREFPDEARTWDGREARAAGLACARCGTDLRCGADERGTDRLAFAVPAPEGGLRFECGGCHPEFTDPATAPWPPSAVPPPVDGPDTRSEAFDSAPTGRREAPAGESAVQRDAYTSGSAVRIDALTGGPASAARRESPADRLAPAALPADAPAIRRGAPPDRLTQEPSPADDPHPPPATRAADQGRGAEPPEPGLGRDSGEQAMRLEYARNPGAPERADGRSPEAPDAPGASPHPAPDAPATFGGPAPAASNEGNGRVPGALDAFGGLVADVSGEGGGACPPPSWGADGAAPEAAPDHGGGAPAARGVSGVSGTPGVSPARSDRTGPAEHGDEGPASTAAPVGPREPAPPSGAAPVPAPPPDAAARYLAALCALLPSPSTGNPSTAPLEAVPPRPTRLP